MNFTDKQMQFKWKSKNQSCKKRKIPMLLTKEQFFFLYQHNDLVCDYTGLTMSTDHTCDDFISLERIDPLLPYQLGNICFISKAANHIKGSIFDQADHGQLAGVKLKGKYRELFFQLVDVIRNHDYINMIKDKYSKENVDKMMNTNEIKIDHELPQPTKTHNTELDIAHQYVEFGKFIEQVVDSSFELTYSQFKTLVSRKTCMLTKRPLPDNVYQLGLFVFDKTAPITKGNVFVTTKKIQESFDTLQASVNMSKEELKNMIQVLGK